MAVVQANDSNAKGYDKDGTGTINTNQPRFVTRVATETKYLLGPTGAMYYGTGNTLSFGPNGWPTGVADGTPAVPETKAVAGITKDGEYILYAKKEGTVFIVQWRKIEVNDSNGTFKFEVQQNN